MARIRTIKPGVGMHDPTKLSKRDIAFDELRQGEALVYRFIDVDGECIYIGVTESPLNRWQAHRARKPWWSEVAAIYYVAGLNKRVAWSLEREAILDERPKYNRTVSR